MKLLVVAALLFCVGATVGSAQCNEARLIVKHMLDGKQFDTTVVVSRGGDYYRFTALRYYLSNIELVYKNGQTEKLLNTYLLIDANSTRYYSLGCTRPYSIDSIRFYIGVEPARNHADPSTYPFTHPLAPQNPSMHWGWAGGYRFIALDALKGSTPELQTTSVLIHSLGDELYTYVSVAVLDEEDDGAPTIHFPTIVADYTKAFNGIDISQGVINHSSEGECAALMQNFATVVFSPATTTGVATTDNPIAAPLHVYPNPASEQVVIESQLPDNTVVSLTDVVGREVASGVFMNGRAAMSVNTLSAGSYVATARDHRTIQSIRVSVAP